MDVRRQGRAGAGRPVAGAARVLVAVAVLLTPVACGGGADGAEGWLPGAGDVRLHYRVLGTAPDTVVVVHGGPGAGMGSVLPDLEPLARDFTVIFYDQRGGGRSTLPEDTSLLASRWFVEDLEAVRRHFGLERLKLVTHSFGSVLAASYAVSHPDRVERLVLHGATGPVRSDAARLARRAPPTPDPALADSASGLLRSLLRGAAADPVAACRAYEAAGRRLAALGGETVTWRGSTCDAPPEAVAYYYRYTAQLAPRSFGDWDFSTGLEALTAPVLVVYGSRDSAAVAPQRAWAGAVPDGRVLLVPGAGKAAFSDRPDVVLPAVTGFLKGEWPEGAEPVE